jgi:hypothetical protein
VNYTRCEYDCVLRVAFEHNVALVRLTDGTDLLDIRFARKDQNCFSLDLS